MRRVSVVGAGEQAMPVSRDSTAGESSTFADFYRAELPGLIALARALCGTAGADDIAQEAMLAAFRRWDEVERFNEPHAWVRRTCANMAISAFRRRLVELRGLARLARPSVSPPLDESSEEFWTAVRSLPRRQAQCAALRYLYGMTGEEIARTLDISEGSVKSHLARAKGSLTANLGVDKEARP
jgi:RNA polymerase sigma factor (sigma-70 family)